MLLPGAASAQEPDIPLLWEPRERLAAPDLSALPRLRFLTSTDFPPFNAIDAQGQLSGFHVDLARAICAELKLGDKCQIQALPWNELRPALLRGEGEAIIAGVAASGEARQTLGFTRPFLWFPARFVTLKDQVQAEPLAKSLKGKTVGVLADSAHEKMLRAEFAGLDVKPYAKPEELYRDLRTKKIAAVFGDGMRLSYWLAGEEGRGCCAFAGGPYLAPEYLGTGLSIAVKREDAALLAALDYALQAIATNGRFTELYLRTFPVGFY
ncbi:MAG: transporter substrate-binding domain-containing protein [Methylobacterium mesophilicum]|nr:transporter substrate-binding domain-containing protein [Methylobacterium mesophilicum]